MSNSRVRSAALGIATMASALLFAAAGPVAAQETYPPGTPPPQPCAAEGADPDNCRPVGGGAGIDAPPVLVDRGVATAGSPVTLTVDSGFFPESEFTVGIVRANNGAVPEVLVQETVGTDGVVTVTVTIPADAQPGVYIIYIEGVGLDGEPIVSTVAFVVVPEEASQAFTTTSTSGTSGGSASVQRRAAQAVGVTAADLPTTWTPPSTSFASSPKVAAAITEAVNLRLAALKTDLPVVADAPTVAASGSSGEGTDLTPWYLAGGAVLLAGVGAAGVRRRSITKGAAA